MKFLLASALFFGAFALRAEPRLVNGVAVIVNDVIITYKDVQNRIADELDFLERRYRGNPKELEAKIHELEQERIEELVERQLILKEFEAKSHNLPETFIENRIAEDIREHGDRLTLTKTLQAQGLTFEGYRKKVRERIIVEAMYVHNVPRDPVISPQRVETFYVQNQDKFRVEDQVKLRMIVLTNRPSDAAFSPKKMAGELMVKLEEGVPFAELAKIYSQGTQSAEGGDWGLVARSVLRKDLADQAFALKAGQRALVESPEGVYLMLAEEVHSAHVKALSKVREEIEATLKSGENKRLRKQWIERLKNKSFVRYF